jgi:hypothetical protein
MIPDNARFSKTAKGIEEVEKRTYRLPTRLRSSLILVFSSRTAAELRENGAAMGSPPEFLDLLLEGGLKVFFFQLKVQKLGNVDDVREFLPAYEEFMRKQAGEEKARVYGNEIRRLVG